MAKTKVGVSRLADTTSGYHIAKIFVVVVVVVALGMI